VQSLRKCSSVGRGVFSGRLEVLKGASVYRLRALCDARGRRAESLGILALEFPPLEGVWITFSFAGYKCVYMAEYQGIPRWGKHTFRHVANHQASASHNGITVSSAFLIPSAKALASEHAISRSRSSKARLRESNSKSSTSLVRIGDFRDVNSLFTGIDDSFLLPNGLPCSCTYSRARSLRSPLTREIHSTQKAAQVPCQCNEADCHKFDGKPVAWQVYSPPSGAKMDPPYHPDHYA
jgi:hypothetical protein